MNRKCIVVVLSLVLAGGVTAQSMSSSTDSQEAKLLSSPPVPVPQEALASGLGGVVSVLVAVDDSGSVKSVIRAAGPGWICPSVTRADVVALRDAAKAAALQAHFTPATRKSKPVKTIVWINFNFPTKKANTSDRSGLDSQIGDTKIASRSGGTGTTGSNTLGVLKGRAKSLPKPPYPPSARPFRASGTVAVRVLIDEEGRVFTAEPISGHMLLRGAAASAACSAEFSPTLLEGKPVKVTGEITYNFVP